MNDSKLNDYEKLDAVQRKANQIVEKARMQEKLLAI